jgi:hypothetical protein
MTNYRGKYPNRIKAVGYSRACGWHVETNAGNRYAFTTPEDCAAIVKAYPVRGIEPGIDIADVLAVLNPAPEAIEWLSIHLEDTGAESSHPYIVRVYGLSEDSAPRLLSDTSFPTYCDADQFARGAASLGVAIYGSGNAEIYDFTGRCN